MEKQTGASVAEDKWRSGGRITEKGAGSSGKWNRREKRRGTAEPKGNLSQGSLQRLQTLGGKQWKEEARAESLKKKIKKNKKKRQGRCDGGVRDYLVLCTVSRTVKYTGRLHISVSITYIYSPTFACFSLLTIITQDTLQVIWPTIGWLILSPSDLNPCVRGYSEGRKEKSSP
jgi:hypothetical protein